MMTTWKVLPVFIALLSVIIFNLDSSSDPKGGFQSEDGAVHTPVPHEEPSVDSWRRYIVRFRGYKRADEHKVYLQQNLRSDGWRWIERKNPASTFPTDFALVSIDDQLAPGLVDDFGKLGFVKDVFAESRYSRGLLEKESVDANEMKKPGKIFTSMSFDDGGYSNSTFTWNRKLMIQRSQITSLFGAEKLWSQGYTGAKVKMAIFDTGIRANHPHFRNIKERTNWTNEDTLNDNLGHGTFVAGVIAGEDSECLGFAPDAEIYAFRVFTDAQPNCRCRIHHGFWMHSIMPLQQIWMF